MKNREFINRLICLLGLDFYSFTKTNFIGYNCKVIITCKYHGDFLVTPLNVLYHNSRCPECSRINLSKSKSLKKNEFEKIIYKQFDYIQLLSDYINSKTKIKFICKKCGKIYFKSPSNLYKWKGCKCIKS